MAKDKTRNERQTRFVERQRESNKKALTIYIDNRTRTRLLSTQGNNYEERLIHLLDNYLPLPDDIRKQLEEVAEYSGVSLAGFIYGAVRYYRENKTVDLD